MEWVFITSDGCSFTMDKRFVRTKTGLQFMGLIDAVFTEVLSGLYIKYKKDDKFREIDGFIYILFFTFLWYFFVDKR